AAASPPGLVEAARGARPARAADPARALRLVRRAAGPQPAGRHRMAVGGAASATSALSARGAAVGHLRVALPPAPVDRPDACPARRDPVTRPPWSSRRGERLAWPLVIALLALALLALALHALGSGRFDLPL